MKILITGAAGFVGKYCLEYFEMYYDYRVFATKLPSEATPKLIPFSRVKFFDVDLLDTNSIENALKNSKPDYILHLAAQSSVAVSWKNPAMTIDVNIKGTVNLLDTIRKLKINPKIILVGSSEEYGVLPKDASLIDENTPVHPGNIYAMTKAAQNMIGSIYVRAYNMNICMTRAFNHIGKGQAPTFVASDFCRQTALIEAGLQEPIIKTGNLSAMRDFLDVRDVVAAYGEIFLKGKAGTTYNIGSGKAIKIEDILKLIISFSDTEIKTETEKARLRPVDVPKIEADVSILKKDTKWSPEYNINDTLKEMLDYWRKEVRKEMK